jgi:hypothetical protein
MLVSVLVLASGSTFSAEEGPVSVAARKAGICFLYMKESFQPEERASYECARLQDGAELLEYGDIEKIRQYGAAWICWADTGKYSLLDNPRFIAAISAFVDNGGGLLLSHLAPVMIGRLVKGEVAPDSVWTKEFNGTGGFEVVSKEHPIFRAFDSPVWTMLKEGDLGSTVYAARYSVRKPVFGKVIGKNIYGADADVVEWKQGKGTIVVATEWLCFSRTPNSASKNLGHLTENILSYLSGTEPDWALDKERKEALVARERILFSATRTEKICDGVEKDLDAAANVVWKNDKRRALEALEAECRAFRMSAEKGLASKERGLELIETSLRLRADIHHVLNNAAMKTLDAWMRRLGAPEDCPDAVRQNMPRLLLMVEETKELYENGLVAEALRKLAQMDNIAGDARVEDEACSLPAEYVGRQLGPLVYSHGDRPRFITYGVGCPTHAIESSDELGANLKFLAGYGITHATVGVPEDAAMRARFMKAFKDNRIVPLSLFLYHYPREMLVPHPDVAAVQLDGTVHPFLPCVSSPAWTEELCRRIEAHVRGKSAAGTAIEEISSSMECYCPNCRKKYRELFREDMPFDWIDGKFLVNHPSTVQFKKSLFLERFKRMSEECRVSEAALAIWTMFDFLSPGDDCWNDFPAFAEYVDFLLPETYYHSAGESPFLMFSVARADHKGSGHVFPAFDFNEQAATPFSVARGAFYAFLGGSGGCAQFGESKAASGLWNGYARGKVLFERVYPGTIKVFFPRIGIFVNERQKAFYPAFKYAAAQGWFRSLKTSGFPVSLVDSSLLSSPNEEILGKFDVMVLPDSLFLSDAECAKIADLCEKGLGFIVTHNTSLYDETGTPRKGFGIRFLPERLQPNTVNELQPEASEPGVEAVLDAPKLLKMKVFGQRFSNRISKDGTGRVLISDRSGNPVMLAGIHGKGRFCYLSTMAGADAYHGFWRSRESSNGVRAVSQWYLSMLPLVTKWVAKPSGKIDFIARPWGGEAYVIESMKGENTIIALLNTGNPDSSFVLVQESVAGKRLCDLVSGEEIKAVDGRITVPVKANELRYVTLK